MENNVLIPAHRGELHLYLRTHLPAKPTGAEVGVREGWYSKYLLDHLDFTRFYCIDAWRHLEDYEDIFNNTDGEHELLFEQTQERLAEYGNRVVLLRTLSTEAIHLIPDESLDFIYIDANHSYAACKRDLFGFYPKMRRGAIMAGHDYLNETRPEGVFGVKAAVDEFLASTHVSDFFVIPEYWPTWVALLA